ETHERFMGSETFGWIAARERPALFPGEAHVWRASGVPDAASLAEFALTLSDDERAQAARFRFERDRARFIRAHGILREVLARYLAASPARLSFVRGPFGKPSLAGAELEFSLSHCEDLVLVAVSRCGAVGVDVERVREISDARSLAARFFTRGENTALAAAPAGERRELFFAIWTRKEAYVKATGEGLSRPLDSFETARLEPPPAPCAALRDLPLGPGRAGALASLGPIGRLQFHDFGEA
ncbi:MAG TPA: 4'-phosphopantetheinyl transferase superfamily protein, partial [Methylocystis sp.]|nr:4'-phosphopantetheinyl transferase superfamily protein [Methylocystis sp.]